MATCPCRFSTCICRLMPLLEGRGKVLRVPPGTLCDGTVSKISTKCLRLQRHVFPITSCIADIVVNTRVAF